MTGCRRLVGSLRSTPTPSPVRHFNEARESLRPIPPAGGTLATVHITHDVPPIQNTTPASLDTDLDRASIPSISWAISKYGLMDGQTGVCAFVENQRGRPNFWITGAFLSRSPGYDKGQSKKPAQNPLPRPPCPCPATMNIHRGGGT